MLNAGGGFCSCQSWWTSVRISIRCRALQQLRCADVSDHLESISMAAQISRIDCLDMLDAPNIKLGAISSITDH